MTEENNQYYAFISYKREDESWAKWLQKKLEHYKLPANLNGRADIPKELRPIFRDTSELMPGNLPQQLHDALAQSKYLIVICSPNSAQSEWVNKEIDDFISMGKSENIIPFIVGGTPFASNPAEECYPQAIRNLPADRELLGANINEMGRDAAAIKVVARMIGLKFDALWQRYERDMKRRKNILMGVLAAFLVAVTGVAAYIWSQNITISRQYRQLEISSAANNAQYALELLKGGDMAKAEELLTSCFLDTKMESEIESTVEMERALRYWYRMKYGNTIYGSARVDVGLPLSIWPAADNTFFVSDADVSFCKISAVSGKVLDTYSLPKNLDLLLDFDGKDMVTYQAADSTVHLFNLQTSADKLVKDYNFEATIGLPDGFEERGTSPSGQMVFAQQGSQCIIYDTKKHEVAKRLTLTRNVLCAALNDSLTVLAVACDNQSDQYKDTDLEVWAIDDGTRRGVLKMTWSSKSWIELSPDSRYLFFSDVGKLQYVDLTTDTPLEQSVVGTNVNPALNMVFSKDGSSLCISSINGVYLWSWPSASPSAIESIDFGNPDMDIERDKDGTTVLQFLKNDKVVKTVKTKVKWQWDEGYASLSTTADAELMSISMGNELSVYNTVTGERLWTKTCDNLVSGTCFNKNKEQLCASDWDGLVRIYDATTGKEVRRLTGAEERLSYCKLSADGRYVMAEDFSGKACLWFLSTGELLDAYRCLEEEESPSFPTLSSIKRLLLK